jgi:tripartite-type tricarboxylate transporter receptor subunit TctC
MRDAGFPTVVITGWNGLLAPAGVPREIVNRVQIEVAKYLLSPNTKAMLVQLGADPVGSTPEQFSAFIKAEDQKWSKVIKQAGLEHTQ